MLRTFVSFALLLFGCASSIVAQEQQQLRLDLNIPALQLVIWEGDEILTSYPVAVGALGHETPTGAFTISHAEWNPWWRPPQREWARDDKITPPGPNNPMGRVKLFFAPLYFIHGTPDANSIGSPASHGCVRMRNQDVIALGKLLHERASSEVSDRQIDRILARSGTTRHLGFQREIPLTIRYQPVVVEGDELVSLPDVYGWKGVHTESVYQALLTAGYDISKLSRAEVERFLEQAGEFDGVYRTKIADAFGTSVALARD